MNAFYLLSAVFTISLGDAKPLEQVKTVKQEKEEQLQKLRAEYNAVKARQRNAPLPGDVILKDRLQEKISRLTKELQ
jgi:hypothetical protein